METESALSDSCFANYQIWKHGEFTHALVVLTGENLRDVTADAASANTTNAMPPPSPFHVNAPLYISPGINIRFSRFIAVDLLTGCLPSHVIPITQHAYKLRKCLPLNHSSSSPSYFTFSIFNKTCINHGKKKKRCKSYKNVLRFSRDNIK
jgi:hypothetical protein